MGGIRREENGLKITSRKRHWQDQYGLMEASGRGKIMSLREPIHFSPVTLTYPHRVPILRRV